MIWRPMPGQVPNHAGGHGEELEILKRTLRNRCEVTSVKRTSKNLSMFEYAKGKKEDLGDRIEDTKSMMRSRRLEEDEG